MDIVVVGLALAIVVGVATFSILAAVVAGLTASLLTYQLLPVLSFGFLDVWQVAALSVLVAFVAEIVNRALFESSDDNRIVKSFILFCGFLSIVGAGDLYSIEMFHAKEYGALLGPVQTLSFEQAVHKLKTDSNENGGAVIDQVNVRLVDAGLAERRASSLLGADPEFGSSFVLADMHLTRRNGRLTWAAPLEFNGLTRWYSTRSSPGYVWVDAHDSRQAGVVKETSGQPIAMRCLNSSWFQQNLQRSVRANGMKFTGLMDYSFEIEPSGRPMYVVTTYVHKIGMHGNDPSGIVVFDPQTCTQVLYGMNDIPAWVNRVVPSSVAQEQVADYGSYHLHGWLNSAFGAGADVLDSNDEPELVSTSSNGDTSWYIGMSTPGNPNGTTGFMLVDSRTKKATFFKQPGVTELSASHSIINKVAQMKGWQVDMPILYNIAGRPTYLSLIKDESGNYKQVGMMPVNDPNMVVVADDLVRALQIYQQMLAGQSVGINGVSSGSPDQEITGTVVRFSSEVVDGNSFYYLILAGQPTILMASNRIGPQVAMTMVGDYVNVSVHGDAGTGTMSVVSLVNITSSSHAKVPDNPVPH